MQNSSIKINEASATHSGLVRETNEDAFWADSTIRLWVVADGMGGHRAGEVASAIVIKEIPRSIQNGKSLSEAISVAHLAIRDAAAISLPCQARFPSAPYQRERMTPQATRLPELPAGCDL